MKNILECAANAGASMAAYTFIRLNGSVKLVFHEWLVQKLPGQGSKSMAPDRTGTWWESKR
jgi:DNA repair photolyase